VLPMRRLTSVEAEDAPERRPWLGLVLVSAFMVYVVIRLVQMSYWAVQAVAEWLG
jgi:hypothetical protein